MSPTTTSSVPVNGSLYRQLLALGAGITGGCFVLAASLWNTVLFSVGGIVFGGCPTFLLLGTAYAVLSWREVGANQLGAAYCYGSALRVLGSGLHYAPFGLVQIKVVPKGITQFQAPGEPEQVFKEDDKMPLPPGMVRPIRVVTAEGDRSMPSTKRDILDHSMTMTLSFYLQFAITDILVFIANFGDMEEFKKQVRDIGEAELAETAAQLTPRNFIAKLQKINEDLAKHIDRLIGNSGVDIMGAQVISPDLSHEVSGSLADIVKARAKADSLRFTSEGERDQLINQGEGKATAERKMLDARADGMKKMRENMGVSGEAILAAETTRSLSDKTIILAGAEGGMRDLMATVVGGMATLDAQKKGAQPAPKPEGDTK